MIRQLSVPPTLEDGTVRKMKHLSLAHSFGRKVHGLLALLFWACNQTNILAGEVTEQTFCRMVEKQKKVTKDQSPSALTHRLWRGV